MRFLKVLAVVVMTLAAFAFFAGKSEAGGRGFANRSFSAQFNVNQGTYGGVGAGFNIGYAANRRFAFRQFNVPACSYSVRSFPQFAAPGYAGCGGNAGAFFAPSYAGGYSGGYSGGCGSGGAGVTFGFGGY
jgi:hypothetical protein